MGGGKKEEKLLLPAMPRIIAFNKIILEKDKVNLTHSDRGRFSFELELEPLFLYHLTVEKKQIYKLTARHRVPLCELVDLLFLKEIVKMSASLWIF